MPALWVNNFLSWAKPRKVHVNDGGTWTSVRNIYVNNSGTWHRVFTRGLWTTITSGVSGSGDTGYNRQFSFPPHMGSASEITLVDGKTLTSLYHNDFAGGVICTISGFSSDPGASYLQSIVIVGWGTLTVGSGAYSGYSYGSAAQWNWIGVGSSPFINGVQTAVEIYTS